MALSLNVGLNIHISFIGEVGNDINIRTRQASPADRDTQEQEKEREVNEAQKIERKYRVECIIHTLQREN